MTELARVPGITEKAALRITDPSFAPTARQIAYARKANVRPLPITAPQYPKSLKEIPDAPSVLLMRGDLDERDRFAVALVGSRMATPYGRSIAAQMARDLARAGLTIVSGGALGIDGVVHRAALDAGGRTLVVLGCGLDVEYPRENQPLFHQIVNDGRGALLSEYPLGAGPDAWRFPVRNRIISGLSMGIVVVEAGEQSGALLTASLAGEHGRDVMAVPGNVDRPKSRGTNALIKDGAALVENAKDVLATLGVLMLEPPDATPPTPPLPPDLTPGQRRLLECLTLSPKQIDALAVEAQMPGPDVSVNLTMLELAGLVRRVAGNSYIRVL
ncbi:MAG: DNA-processing protein DprA [Chthonomonadales bacterium]